MGGEPWFYFVVIRTTEMTLRRNVAAVVVVLACVSPRASAQDQQTRYRGGWPCNGTIDRAYIRTAEASGGKVILFTKAEVTGLSIEMAASRGHDDTVFRGAGTLADGVYDFEIPIDSTIESAYFYVSLQCLQFVNVFRPSGDELRVDGADVTYHPFEAIRLYTIKAPAPGIWKIRMAGRGFFTLIANAKTDLSLDGVSFVAGGVRVSGLPKLGAQVRLEARVSGAATQIGFQFISSKGPSLRTFDLALEDEKPTRRMYAGDVTLPATEFRIAMTGVDANGFAFQRVRTQLFIAIP